MPFVRHFSPAGPWRHRFEGRPYPSSRRSPGPLEGGTIVTQIKRLAFIGNSLPRRCGIATFTTDLQQAVATFRPRLESCIVAMTDHGRAYDFPSTVGLQVNDDKLDDYVRAADFLNADQCE